MKGTGMLMGERDSEAEAGPDFKEESENNYRVKNSDEQGRLTVRGEINLICAFATLDIWVLWLKLEKLTLL